MLLPASTPSHAYTVRIAPTMAPFELHVPCAVTSAFRTMAWKPLEQMDRSFLFLSIPSFLRIPFFSTFHTTLWTCPWRSTDLPSVLGHLPTSSAPSQGHVHLGVGPPATPPPAPPTHLSPPPHTNVHVRVRIPVLCTYPAPSGTWAVRTLRLPAERPHGQRSFRSMGGPRRSCWGRGPPPPTVFTNELTSRDVRACRAATRFDVRQRRRRRHERGGRVDGSHPRVRLRVHGSRAPRNHRTHGAWRNGIHDGTVRRKRSTERNTCAKKRRKARGNTSKGNGSKGLTRCTSVERPLLRTGCARRSLIYSTVRRCH